MSVAQATTAPIVKIAAGAVIILSAVGVGVMTGLIPGVSSQEKAPQAIEAPAANQAPPTAVTNTTAMPTEAPVQQAHTKPAHKEHMRVATAEPMRQAAPVCVDCGTIESINQVEVKGEGTGAGAVIGGVAGLIVGNQIGHGKGKTLAKVAGAAGGAYAGHEIEKNARKTMQYDVTVRMNDGTLRTLRQPTSDGLAAGVKVKVNGETITPI